MILFKELLARTRSLSRPLFAVCSVLVMPVVIAVNPPDAGRLFQDIQPDRLSLPINKHNAPGLALPHDQSAPKSKANEVSVFVKGFRFTGNTVIDGAVLNHAVRSYTQRTLTFNQLEDVLNLVREFYQSRGYFAARAYLPEQEIKNGVITIAVLEGRIEDVDLAPNPDLHVNSSVVRPYLDVLKGSVIQYNTIERSLLLLGDVSGIKKANARISPGDSLGTSKLNVTLEPDNRRWDIGADANNYGSRYTGIGYVGTTIRAINIGNSGGDVGLRVQSSEGLNIVQLSSTQPVGAQGLKLSSAVGYMYYHLCCGFSSLDANGNVLDISSHLSYPLVRQQNFNLSMALGVTGRALYNEATGSPLSNKRVQLEDLSVGGEYILPQRGLQLSGTLSAVMGELNLSRVPDDAQNDAGTAKTAGAFQKLVLNATGIYGLMPKWWIYARFNGQWASKNLDSSEQISLGGAQSVRAYPIGEAPGDEGFITNLELHYQPYENMQYAIFYDIGEIRSHKHVWEGGINDYVLRGAGISVQYSLSHRALIELAWAHVLGDNAGASALGLDSDSRSLNNRVWLQVHYAIN